MKVSKKLDIPITAIGRIMSSKELVLYDSTNTRIELNSGYKHF
jgi:thiamine monophosphate kinase